jgi:hypothetical protein
MKLGLRRSTEPAPAAPRRRPSADRQCVEPARSTGLRCSQWSLPGAERCRSHSAPSNALATIPAEPHPASLSGSVATVQLDGVGWQTWRPGSRAWQNDGWRLYDITGQLRFVANWVGNSVSRCRLYVAEVDESGEAGPETDDPDIANLAAGPLGVGPAKDEALRLLGINLFVPGEAYVIAESDAGDNGDDRWFVVSGRQIRRSGDQVIIRRSLLHGGGDMVFRPGIDLILRVWTPHPADTDEPDSPTRSAIPDLREIEALRKREFAELDSRLAGAGILPLPEGIDFPAGDDEPPGLEGFIRRLSNTMARSLSDRSSAEAMVPIMFTVPGEYLDKIKQVTFWSELSSQLLPLRTAAVISLAQSLDVPPEILLGQGDSNHWSSWQVSEDAITTQIVPILSRIADALTTGYLRVALETMGLDPNRYVYAFDPSPLTVRPNRSADALNYHAAGLISDEAAVDAGAFRPDEMPSADERLRRLAEAAVASNPTLMLTDPTIRALVGITTPPPPPPPAAVPIAPAPAPAPPPAPAPAPAAEPRALPQPTPQTEQPAAALIPVAGLAVRRALALAGGRLIPHQQRDQWPDTPRHQLHTRHGAISTAKADAVLRGAWDDLGTVAAELGLDAGQLEALLHGFACELLTRGMAYEQRLLHDLLRAAMRGRRLDAMAGAV